MINVTKSFLKDNNFAARVVTFGMIPFGFRLSHTVCKWISQGESLTHMRLFGFGGIILGALIGHLLYYYWIFPEKRKGQAKGS